MNRRESEILRLAKVNQKKQIAWRRRLHQHPELSNQEHHTTAFLRNELSRIGLRILPLRLKTGVLAELVGDYPGPTIAVRSDIDALPILEQNRIPFSSRRAGVMHACGHDVHMATVLGVATVTARFRSQMNGRIRFIFQPAEEMPPGGARPMIENGALKDVDMIFGLHVDPHVPVGQIGLRDGVTMASVYDFDLIVHGRAGHAARPHLAVDAITTAAELIDSIQKIVSREIDPVDPVVVTFGQIQGGTARNVVADTVRLEGTARTLSERARRSVPALIRRTATGIARARGASIELRDVASYPLLRNDAAVNKLIEETFTVLFGKGKIVTTEPVLGGEDFACYLEQVPGAMFRLGVMNRKLKADQPWHSPAFMVDENAMLLGTALLAGVALNVLAKEVQ